MPGGRLPDMRTHLAATLTNKATCLDGLIGMTRPEMNGLLGSLDDTYKHVSILLALIARHYRGGGAASFAAVVARIHNRRLL